MKRWLWSGVLILALLLIYIPNRNVSRKSEIAFNLGSILNTQTKQNFARVDEPRTFKFPQDHFSHPEYRIEWWYLTGNLEAETGNQYGYQITFFRTALKPGSPQRSSRWASHQIWMAHLAVSDINQQKHYQSQRLSRAAIGLAGIQQQPFKIWLEDWQIIATGQGDFPWHIVAKDKQVEIDLLVNPLKSVVLQGDRGLSQKSSQPGNASYYYSFTRLKTTGTITVNGAEHKVNGLSWLDREWSTSALGKNQSGWDWFSLQFNSGEELMYYQLRDKTGKSDRNSQGKWVKTNGETINLKRQDVKLVAIDYWQAESGGKYPVKWRLRIPKISQDLLIKAAIDDQLMRGSIHYWEGAVMVYQTNNNKPVGKGYLEMTGYE